MIGNTRQKKGNVIPGVAIATALMPPLCTAGYGIATLQPRFLLGAFYLFAINTLFIALSATHLCLLKHSLFLYLLNLHVVSPFTVRQLTAHSILNSIFLNHRFPVDTYFG